MTTKQAEATEVHIKDWDAQFVDRAVLLAQRAKTPLIECATEEAPQVAVGRVVLYMHPYYFGRLMVLHNGADWEQVNTLIATRNGRLSGIETAYDRSTGIRTDGGAGRLPIKF